MSAIAGFEYYVADGDKLEMPFSFLRLWPEFLDHLYWRFAHEDGRDAPVVAFPHGKEDVIRFMAVSESSSSQSWLQHYPAGMATLVLHRKGTGEQAIGCVEDVFVLRHYRGRGIARTLNEAIIEEACRLGLERLELTSKPDRVAANRLYRELGYKLVARAVRRQNFRGTNYYQLYL